MDQSNNVVAINDEIASILGISTPTNNALVVVTPAPLPPVPTVRVAPPIPVRIDQPSQAENDAEYARDNLYDVISKVDTLINEMMPVASQSQAPRAYEVLNSLLNTQRETAALLLKIQADRMKLKGGTGGQGGLAPAGNVHIANAVFVGTNAQLLDLIKGKNRAQEATIKDAEFLVDDDDDTTK